MTEEEISIIDKENLYKKLTDFGFIPIEVAAMNKENYIYLNRELESFLTLANTFEQIHIFFEYYYYDKDKYVIPINWYDEQTQEYQKTMREQNDLVDQINFDLPFMLTVFIIKNGDLIGIMFEDNWIEGKNILSAEEAIEEIENNFRPKNKTKKEEDEREMRKIIFNDPEFMYCKNQELRFEYLREFIEKEEHKKFLYVIKPFGGPMRGKAKMFMDKTWILYKDKMKNKKEN